MNKAGAFHNSCFMGTKRFRMTLLLSPIKKTLFIYLFILNLISSFGVYFYLNGWIPVFCMVMLAAWLAYMEVALFLLIRWKSLQFMWISFVVLLHNIFILLDYYLYFQFKTAFGQDAINVLAETNIVEAKNFFDTYLSFTNISLWLLFLLVSNVVIYKISSWVVHFNIGTIVSFSFVLLGWLIVTLFVYNFSVYRNGLDIPLYLTTTRVGYALYNMYHTTQNVVVLRDVCRKTKAVCSLKDQPTMVLVIGESHSVYHSSLYGYDKLTMPCMQKRVNDSTLFVFDNVVSTACGTHKAMLSIFSLDSLGNGFAETPLFPACFKAAGYKALMYDNQYFIGNSMLFLSDSKLSGLLFDERNTERYNHDMEMINTIHEVDYPALYIIHLWGQHYTYSERYPKSYSLFCSNDYDKSRWTEDQREIIAHYDNATYYVDKVLDEIIRHFEDKNCCLVYLSDHGEEIYELSNYIGHGSAEHSSDLKYQIRVPFLIWTSKSYSRPEIVERLSSLQHIPITTDDVSHLLIDLAGIQTPGFKPTRSVVNSRYNRNKRRMVLNSIDYDSYQPQ